MRNRLLWLILVITCIRSAFRGASHIVQRARHLLCFSFLHLDYSVWEASWEIKSACGHSRNTTKPQGRQGFAELLVVLSSVSLWRQKRGWADGPLYLPAVAAPACEGYSPLPIQWKLLVWYFLVGAVEGFLLLMIQLSSDSKFTVLFLEFDKANIKAAPQCIGCLRVKDLGRNAI